MICELCGKSKKRGEFLELKSREVFVCRDCQSYINMNGLHVEGGVMVVPVKPPSFERALKKKTYFRPWRRKPTHAAFLAFYHQGAVTHVGKVKQISVKVNKDDLLGFLPGNEKWGKKEYYTVYSLAYADALKCPIPREGTHIVQSKLVVPFRKFVEAKNVRDLL